MVELHAHKKYKTYICKNHWFKDTIDWKRFKDTKMTIWKLYQIDEESISPLKGVDELPWIVLSFILVLAFSNYMEIVCNFVEGYQNNSFVFVIKVISFVIHFFNNFVIC